LDDQIDPVREPRLADHEDGSRDGLGALDLDLLHEALDAVDRLESPALHLAARVGGGDPFIARAAAAALERVAREEGHVPADGGRGDGTGRRGGWLGGGGRGAAGHEEAGGEKNSAGAKQ
jgi:hypothetical protein